MSHIPDETAVAIAAPIQPYCSINKTFNIALDATNKALIRNAMSGRSIAPSTVAN